MVGPRYSRKTEKVALVSRRKEMGRPSTIKVTLASCLVMEMIRQEVPGPHQSSSDSPTMAGLGWGLFVQPPLRVVGQSDPQWPILWHLGHGVVGDLGEGHTLDQCPSFPHLKQAPGGGLFVEGRPGCGFISWANIWKLA